jgi:hypothetical protein
MKLPRNKPEAKRKGISFDASVQMKEIMGLDDYTSQEIEASWYTGEDLEMARRARSIACEALKVILLWVPSASEGTVRPHSCQSWKNKEGGVERSTLSLFPKSTAAQRPAVRCGLWSLVIVINKKQKPTCIVMKTATIPLVRRTCCRQEIAFTYKIRFLILKGVHVPRIIIK